MMDCELGTNLPYVKRLIAGVLLQDEELVPHPTPPPAPCPPRLCEETPQGSSPFFAIRHWAQDGGVQGHGLAAMLLPQGDHTEYSKEANSLHVLKDGEASEDSRHSGQLWIGTV